MTMRDLAMLLAPNTTASVDKVKRSPIEGYTDMPFAVLQDTVRAPLALADKTLGALTSPLRKMSALGALANTGYEASLAARAPGAAEQAELLRARAAYERMNAPADRDWRRAQAGLAGAEAGVLDEQARILGSIGGPVGTVPAPRLPGPWAPGAAPVDPMTGPMDPLDITDELLARLSAAGLTRRSTELRAIRDDARERADRERYDKWEPGALDTRYKEWEKSLRGRVGLSDKRRFIEQTPNTRLGLYQLMQMWQREVDKGAVVREGDIRQIANAIQAKGIQSWDNLVNWFSGEGTQITADAAQKVKQSLHRIVDYNEDEAATIADEITSFADRNQWGEATRNRAIPYLDRLPGLVEARDARRAGMTEDPGEPEPPAIPIIPSGDRPRPFSIQDMPEADVQAVIDQVERDMPGASENAIFTETKKRLMRMGGY